MRAIILAGGKGRRLEPYTTVLPKPLMPVDDLPIIEIVIRQLKNNGFDRITIAVGYLAELLEAYLGDGSKYGLEIDYSRETVPLNTMGPVTLIGGIDKTFLVMNGDILSDLNYSKFIQYHKEKGGIATIATYRREVNIDFGVIEYDENNKIKKFIEKPKYEYDVSMGIYVFEPEILNYIPKNRPFGFDQLMKVLIDDEKPIYSYPYNGYWLDIGRHEDYEKAVKEFPRLRNRFLVD